MAAYLFGCSLYLTIGENSFTLDKNLSPVSSSASCSPTGDETFDAGTQIVQFESSQGENLLAVSCPVGNTGIWLTQTVSSKALGMNLRALYGKQLLLLCLSSVVIGAVVLWMLNRTISRPIQRLQSRMAVIAEGDFSADPSIEWNNELGDIGRGINHLSQSVHGLMEKRLADEKAQQELEYQMSRKMRASENPPKKLDKERDSR